MSIAAVVTRGFCSFSTVNLVPVRGYGLASTTTTTTTPDGARRHRYRHQWQLGAEQDRRLVAEYLASLDRAAPVREQPKIAAETLKAATAAQLEEITESAIARKAVKKAAALEIYRRMYWERFLALAMAALH